MTRHAQEGDPVPGSRNPQILALRVSAAEAAADAVFQLRALHHADAFARAALAVHLATAADLIGAWDDEPDEKDLAAAMTAKIGPHILVTRDAAHDLEDACAGYLEIHPDHAGVRRLHDAAREVLG